MMESQSYPLYLPGTSFMLANYTMYFNLTLHYIWFVWVQILSNEKIICYIRSFAADSMSLILFNWFTSLAPGS